MEEVVDSEADINRWHCYIHVVYPKSSLTLETTGHNHEPLRYALCNQLVCVYFVQLTSFLGRTFEEHEAGPAPSSSSKRSRSPIIESA